MAKRRNTLKQIPVIIKDRAGNVQDDLQGFVDESAVRAIDEDIDAMYKNISNDNIRSGLDPRKIRNVRIKDAEIGTGETAIQHSLGIVPYDYRVIMKNSSAWYQTREPDAQFLYLAGTAAVTADIIIEG